MLVNPVADNFLWCDSKCVLHWLQSNKVLPTFVKNRVNEILSNNLNIKFKYVPTADNSADILCRSKLSDNDKWWNGPKWLCQPPEIWPNVQLEQPTPTNGEQELKSIKIILTIVSS